MEKQFLEAIELLKIGAQHAYCAEYLLKKNREICNEQGMNVEAFLPITTLMYQAFELMLKAYVLQDHSHVRQHKTLQELIELNRPLGLSKQETQLLTSLSKQQAFRKGVDHMLWETREQLHGFCEEIITLYERLQERMPLELQTDYF